MSDIIIHGTTYDSSPLNLKTFKDDGLYRFVNAKRTLPVSEIIVHETVTVSHDMTVAVLQQRQLGVHFIVAPDGAVYQHGDLNDDDLWHATQHNPVSVGIETVNPFYPRIAPPNGPWTKFINAPWADGGTYCVPTPEEAEAVCQILFLLTGSTMPAGLFNIPVNFVGLRGGHVMAMGPFLAAASLSPGIYAHHYFGHGDGSFLVLYSWLRMKAALEPEIAYGEAIGLATGAHMSGIDLSSYLTPTLPPPAAA